METVRYRFGPYVLDLAKRELARDGVPVALPARVFECLVHLIEHRERAVDRDALAQAVFARSDVSDAQLAQVILRSRRAVGDDGQEQQVIRTVPRYGFRWIVPVELERAAPVALPGPIPAMNAAAPAIPEPGTRQDMPAAPLPVPPPAPPRGARRRLWAIVLLLVGSALVLVAWQRLSTGRPAAAAAAARPQASSEVLATPVLVLPVRGGQGDMAWARLGLMDDLANQLRHAGLPVLSSESTLSLLRAGTPDRGHAPDVDALRRQSRADWVVQGRIEGGPGGWTVHWQAQDGQGVLQQAQARGSDLLSTARLAGDRLLAGLGRVPPKRAEASDPGLQERLQRAQAAMLANAFDTARKLLEEAPELQRTQPLLRYRLAAVDFREGRYQEVLATLDALDRTSMAGRDPLFRGRLQLLRGGVLSRLGQFPQAEQQYEAAIATLRPTGSPNELGDALLGRGNARMAQHRLDAALEDFGQARVQLLQSGDALSVARVELAVGSIQLLRGLPLQALDYYRRGAAELRQLGALNELAGVLNLTQAVELQLLQPARALAVSDQAWALLPRLHDPALRASMRLARAEALAASGRLVDAARVLEDSEMAAAPPSERARIRALRITLTGAEPDPGARLAAIDTVLRDWPADQSTVLRTWMRLARQAVWRQAGAPAARADLAPGAGGGLSLALLQAGREPDAIKAEARYHDALREAGTHGIPRDIKQAILAYGDWLIAHRRPADAAGLMGQATPWVDSDFDLAVLQARIDARRGERESWQASLRRARALAGDRALPADAGQFQVDHF